MAQIKSDKPDWVVESEAKLRAFGVERGNLASMQERILTSCRVLRRWVHEAEAG